MSELLKDEMEPLKPYLEKLCDYCDKYDNIAILNQVKALVGDDDDITLSKVYADFELVSKEEYDRGNGKTYNNPFSNTELKPSVKGLDLDAMLRSIDKKIYELDVEEADARGYTVTKICLYINIKSVGKNFIDCQIKEKPEDKKTLTKTLNVKSDIAFLDDIKEQWIWIRGYEAVKSDDSYYLLEPHWYKTNDKLTQQDKDFFESELIIEKKYHDESFEDLNKIIPGNTVTDNKVADSQNEDADTKINGMVVLSEPGGGKTTYLKHMIYEIASDYLNESSVLGSKVSEKYGLDKDGKYIPVFVRTRDLTNILRDKQIEKKDLFDSIMVEGVSNIPDVNDEVSTIIGFINNKSNYKTLFIIDGFEELDDEKAEKLLECINDAYKNGRLDRENDRLIISSRYKEYGYQKLVTFCAEHAIEEKYIKFDNKSDAIEKIIEKWFEILKKSGQDNHAYFNQMRISNSDIGNLITTPLELTGLIMVCQSQSALPTDITVLYRLIIEIWLTYGIKDAGIPFFSLSDIFLELATIAYYMAESEDRLRINRDTMIDIIEKRRVDLRRYYRSNSYVNASSKEEIDELIGFWLKRNIFVKNSNEDIYEFAHREYQSYLISYAIVNNFIPRDKRKSERIEYFESHMNQADDFWDRVIVFSAFMSTDLHDDIIDNIFEKLETFETQEENVSPLQYKNIDKYFLSIILQLTNAEGFYFADEEYERLFEQLFKTDRVSIMKKSVKGSEIKKLLSNGRKDTNTLFLQKAIEVIEACNKDIESLKENGADAEQLETRQKEKSDLIDIVGSIVFHIAWNCDADRDTIKMAFRLYLDNWITMDIIYEIKDSLASYRYNEDRINLIRELGIEAISREEEPLSDFYMIISLIVGYDKVYQVEEVSLYRVALNYFDESESSTDETEKLESLIIALNLVFLTTWFLQGNTAIKCNCALKDSEGKWNKALSEEYEACITKIKEYMQCIEDDSICSRDLYATYRDLCVSKLERFQKQMFNKDILRNCLSIAKNARLIKQSDEKELSYIFEIIALYPLTQEYVDLVRNSGVLKERIEEIEKCRASGKMPSKKAIYLLKLLVFAGAFEEKTKENEIRLRAEINGLKSGYNYIGNKSERDVLESMEKYMREEYLFEKRDYQDLMNYMDGKINEL